MLLGPSRDGVFIEETVSVRLLFLYQCQIFHNQSLMMLILYHLQSPALPLGQVPPFHSNAHCPEHSAQGGSGALSLVPRSPPLTGWAPGCTYDSGSVSPHHRHQMDTSSPGARAAQSSLPCQAHPEPGQYLLTCWQGKENRGHILALGMKDPLDNLYFIYMTSIRL